MPKQAGWKKTPNCRPTVTVSLLDETLEKVEDARFENRFNSRSEAIEYLVNLGLKTLEYRKSKKLAATS